MIDEWMELLHAWNQLDRTCQDANVGYTYTSNGQWVFRDHTGRTIANYVGTAYRMESRAVEAAHAQLIVQLRNRSATPPGGATATAHGPHVS